MTRITVDVADFGGVTHPGDHVIFNSPQFRARAGSATGIVSAAPRRIPLAGGKATVADVAPGPLEVRFRVKNLVETAPFTVMVPDVEEISLRTLLTDEFENTPVVVSTLQALIMGFNKDMDKREHSFQVTLSEMKQAEASTRVNADQAGRKAKEATEQADRAGQFKAQAQQAANSSETSAMGAKQSETNAGGFATQAKQSAVDTQADRAVIQGFHTAVSAMVAEVEHDRAEVEENRIKASTSASEAQKNLDATNTARAVAEGAAGRASQSEINAKQAETNAGKHEAGAVAAETGAKTAETNAGKHEASAKQAEAGAVAAETGAKQAEAGAGKHAQKAATERELTENVAANFNPTVTKVENLASQAKTFRDQAETYAKKAVIGVQPDSVTEGMLTPEVRNKLDGKLDETLVSDVSTAPQGTVVARGADGRVPTRLTPTYNDEAASKQYVDKQVSTRAVNGHKHVSADITDRVSAGVANTAQGYKVVTTYTDGMIHQASDPWTANHVTRKSWVDAQINSVTANAKVDGRNSAAGKLVKWDDGGRIQLPNPKGDANPVTLGYLNNQLGGKVDKSQVSQTNTAPQGSLVARSHGGNISVPLLPDNDNAAASRHYVRAMSDNLFTDPKFRDPCWGLWASDNYGGSITIAANGSQTGVYYQPYGLGNKSLVLEPGKKYSVRVKLRFGGNSNINAVSLHLTGAKGYIDLVCDIKRTAETSYKIGWLTYTFVAPDKLKETNGECSPGFFVERNYTAGSVTIIECHINRYITAEELGETSTDGRKDARGKLVQFDGSGRFKVPGPIEDEHPVVKWYLRNELAKKVDVSWVGQTVGKQGQIVARAQGGNITVPNEPASDNHAASKQYVDSVVSGNFSALNLLVNGYNENATRSLLSVSESLNQQIVNANSYTEALTKGKSDKEWVVKQLKWVAEAINNHRDLLLNMVREGTKVSGIGGDMKNNFVKTDSTFYPG